MKTNKSEGLVVGYTFHGGDLFHCGHLHQLRECRKHCDYLVVGILTDKALASYKRSPIIPLVQRVCIYRGIRAVDEVIVQKSRDPTDNLRRVRPNVLFHGDDWDEIPGTEFMESIGGWVVKTPYFQATSTTEIVKTVLERYK